MPGLSLRDYPHRRLNILTGEWILVSPHRTKRPWQGRVEKPVDAVRPAYDPQCYLCPGNQRAGGLSNPSYTGTYVFTNDFAALLPDAPTQSFEQGLLMAEGEPGLCKVICFSPNHALTLPEMEVEDVFDVIGAWQREYADLGSQPFVSHVQIFENKGEIMGCSNPHPHGQIWAQASVPMEALKKGRQQRAYFIKSGRSLLSDYLKQELQLKERIVLDNEHFVALTPFWAVWPFEAMIIPRRHMQHIGQLTEEEQQAFAVILHELTIRFDNIFETAFPYSMGIHQSPTDGQAHEEWHWHTSFYPPLLRSASVKKFMVGYEMFGEPQRDITAEKAAEMLRNVPAQHYKKI